MGDKVVNSFWKNVLASVIAAAIVALVTVLWSFNGRLARIETKLEILLPSHVSTQTANRL